MRIVALLSLVVLVSACGQADGGTATPVDKPCEAEFAQGEFGSDYAMTAQLSHPPAVRDTATLTVGVCAKKTARAVVSIRLSDRVKWRTPPAGTTVTVAPGAYEGCEETASGEWDLTAMTPMILTGTVVTTKTGTAEVAGSVDPAVDPPIYGNDAYVYFTVGADRESSHFGYPEYEMPQGATNVYPRPPKPVCD